MFKKDRHKGTQRKRGYFPKIKQPNKAEIWTCGSHLLGLCVCAGEPWPCSPAQENAEWDGDGGMDTWPAAYNASGISLQSPPAPTNPLPEYKCIPASLQKSATINATHQPPIKLCTQRQKWIDFEFHLKVNRIAVHFARKSSPHRATRHSTPPLSKITKKQQCFV